MVSALGHPKALELSDYVRIVEKDSPLILILPHSGKMYKDGVPHHLDLSRNSVTKTVNIGIDHCVPHIIQPSQLDYTTIVWTELSRAVVDVNRGRKDYDRNSVDSDGIEPKAQGVIWNATIASTPEGIERMLTHPYSIQEYEELMAQAYDPLVDTVFRSIARSLEKHGTAVLFDVHSIWNNITSIVASGDYVGSYLIGKPAEAGLSIEGKVPNLILMNSGGASCSPKLTAHILAHFNGYSLIVEQRGVASGRYQLAHMKYRKPKVEVFSMEIVGHRGLEEGRAEGKVIFNPNPEYLQLLQQAFSEFLTGLRDLKWRSDSSKTI